MTTARTEGRWDKTQTMAADLPNVIARKDAELAAMRQALEFIRREDEYGPAEVLAVDAALQPDAGAKLLAEHAAQLAAYRDALELMTDAAKSYRSDILQISAGQSRRSSMALNQSITVAEAALKPDSGRALPDRHAAELATLRATQAADLTRIEERYNALIRELEEKARKAINQACLQGVELRNAQMSFANCKRRMETAEQLLAEAKRDTARLDWLAGATEADFLLISEAACDLDVKGWRECIDEHMERTR